MGKKSDPETRFIQTSTFLSEDTFVANVGQNFPVPLKLAPDEIGHLHAVAYGAEITTAIAIFRGLSMDPNEDENIAGAFAVEDDNIVALNFMAGPDQGPILNITEPGIQFAGQLTYMVGFGAGGTFVHGLQIYYSRRKASLEERANVLSIWR